MRLLLALMLLVAGCRDEVTGPRPDLGPRLSVWLPDSTAVLAHEDITGSGFDGHYVARDSGAYAALWDQAYGWMNQSRPAIDFTTEIVILVAASGTAGARVGLDSIVTHERGARAFTRFCDSGSSLAVEGHPGLLLRVPRHDAMSFVRTSQGRCP